MAANDVFPLQVSYIKAIDVWMGMCLAFVFGVMIEFTIVNYWARRKQTPALVRFSSFNFFRSLPVSSAASQI